VAQKNERSQEHGRSYEFLIKLEIYIDYASHSLYLSIILLTKRVFGLLRFRFYIGIYIAVGFGARVLIAPFLDIFR
jgi:hypothetical protein